MNILITAAAAAFVLFMLSQLAIMSGAEANKYLFLTIGIALAFWIIWSIFQGRFADGKTVIRAKLNHPTKTSEEKHEPNKDISA